MAKEIITTNNKALDTYVPFGGVDVDLGREAVTPAPEYPLLQYATGLPAQRPKLDGDGREMYDEDTGEALYDSLYYAGFFTACGKDKALDDAMKARGAKWIDIIHGSGEVVKHWAIEKTALFIMADGVPNNATSNGKYGMVYQWRTKRNSTKSETVLYAQIILRSLFPEYGKPLVFTMKSTQTADALGAMRKQYRVINAAHEALRQHGRDIALPLWSYSAMFGPSMRQEQRGQEGFSKTIFPMISGIPDDISQQYLKRHEVPIEHIEHFREVTEHAVEWAQALSQRIASGVETQEPWKQGNGGDAGAEDTPF